MAYHVSKQRREATARRLARRAERDRAVTKDDIEEAARAAGIRVTDPTGAGSKATKADWIAAVLGEAPEESTESAEPDVTEEE